MRSSSMLALALVASVGAGSAALAQDNQTAKQNALPPECEMLGPELSQETIAEIQDLEGRTQALSCMVGTPRDYQAALAERKPGGDVEIVDISKAWGEEAVAQGLAASAKANAQATEDLQIALQSDKELTEFVERSGYLVDNVFAVAVFDDGSTTLFVVPGLTATDMMATGSIDSGGSGSAGSKSSN